VPRLPYRILPFALFLLAGCFGDDRKAEAQLCVPAGQAPAPGGAQPGDAQQATAGLATGASASGERASATQAAHHGHEGHEHRGAGRELVRCVPSDGPLTQRSLEELQDRALAAEARGDAERMLACADEALRLAEDDAVAAHLRAEALLHLRRIDEAVDAFTLALALAPHDPWLLAGAADLWANELPMRRDRTLTALAWAERGLAFAPPDDAELLVRLHLLAAWAQADLGNFRESLVHAGVALHLRPGDRDARVVRGRALYELTRFEEAVRTLEQAVADAPDDAEAHHLLGLALERIEGRLEDAERHLARATALDPEGFPPPVEVDDAEIAALVTAALGQLPERERGLLERTRVPVRVAPLPSVADLRAVDPPLSPTAVGMFRGPPLGVTDVEPREILLFARNLRRAARNHEELGEQVRITLLHELGHLAGEGEADLRARGLE